MVLIVLSRVPRIVIMEKKKASSNHGGFFMKKYNHFSVEVSSKILTLTLNRPEKANALNRQMWFDFKDVFDSAADNPEVHVCIIKANGKHFSSGADLNFLVNVLEESKKVEQDKELSLYQSILEMQEAFNSIGKCPKPVIAAVHGLCLGAGLDLITACDIRLSTPFAMFSILETKLGIPADMGVLQRIVKVMPLGKAKQLAYTSKPFSGYKARKWGLVDELYMSQSSLYKGAHKLASSIAENSPLAVSHTKASLDYSVDHTLNESLEHIAAINSKVLHSEEIYQGMQAMKAKLAQRKGQ